MPAAFVARHLTGMLAGPMGDALVSGAQSTRCLFDDDATVVDDGTGGEVQRRVRTALVRTGSVTNVVVGSTVTVAGVAYQVRRILPQDDGLLTRLVVTKAD